MAEFKIKRSDLATLKGRVVIITGGSSGIGLATTQLLLEVGASVVNGDINPGPLENSALTFQKADVTSWAEMASLFKFAIKSHGRIDHVFANAGISPRATYFEDNTDADGDPLPPDFRTIDINLKGVINTVSLAMHYLRKQERGGSIVLTASASAYQRYSAGDYTAAKHGVLGVMRSMIPTLQRLKSSIRINAIAPSYTMTGVMDGHPQARVLLHERMQTADVPALSTAILMADSTRQGQLIYSSLGRQVEIEESIMLKAINEQLWKKFNVDEEGDLQIMLRGGQAIG